MTDVIIPFSAMIYGPSKVGKSSLMLSAPDPIWYLDVEGQTRFLPGQDRRQDWDLMGEMPKLNKGVTWLRTRMDTYEKMRTAYAYLASGKHPFKSVVIDSISELQQKYVDKLAGPEQMSQQQWGELLRGMAALVRAFRDLLEHPTNPLQFVGITAMMEDKNGKKIPLVQGKLQQMAPYFLDIVGYYVPFTDLTAGVNTRRLHLSPSPFYEAGSRIPGIADYIDDPTIEGIFNMTRSTST